MADSAYQYIDSTGAILADTSDIQITVEGEYQTAFGADLPVTPDTPQGMLITGEVVSRSAVINNNAAVANQINPNIAGGVFLDAICAFLGLYRQAATFTLVQAVALTGIPNTLIPAGSRAVDGSQNVYASVGAIVLSSTGTGTVDFQCVVSGPIPCPATTLNLPFDTILGWETVSNPSDGILGELEQSDASLRQLRRVALALYGKSSAEAQISTLNAIPGVLSCSFRENVANTTQVIDGITLVAHSVWACVDGGTDLQIASALLENKTDGAGWNGAHSVSVVEPASGQSYTVLFDRTAIVPIIARVTVRQGQSTVDPQTAVRQAVVDYANGLIENERGFVTGATASPFEIAAAVNVECPGIFVAKVELATVAAGAGAYQTTEIPIAINQKASIQASAIVVVSI